MKRNHVTIVGGGMVGLALANTLAQTHIIVDLYEHQPPQLLHLLQKL